MTERAHPDYWYPIANLLVALRRLVLATPPEAFASIARDARAHLAALAALVRRYIHLLAGEIVLPPSRPASPLAGDPDERIRCSARRYRFALTEGKACSGGPGTGDDPPEMQWQIMMEALDRLKSVLAHPAPHALRLARFLRRHGAAPLRELPVPWHIVRRIGPALDTLLLRLDEVVRPQAWAGINSS